MKIALICEDFSGHAGVFDGQTKMILDGVEPEAVAELADQVDPLVLANNSTKFATLVSLLLGYLGDSSLAERARVLQVVGDYLSDETREALTDIPKAAGGAS